MLIPKPDAVQQEKNLLLLMIPDILSEDTSADQRITKEELRKRIEERFGFSPARNTLYDKLRMLEIAGFGIVAGDDGIYLETDHMTDGALKQLRTLELHGTDIKDISFLSECTSVRDLILESCDELTDCSVLVQMKNLRSLRIDYCTSLQDFRFLESMTQLKELSIDSKHFHWEDANRLHKKLPGCRLVTRGYNDDEYYF